MKNFLSNWFNKRKESRALDVQQFAHHHQNYLVIVCDPRDDNIFVAFRNKQISGRIRSEDGLNHHVVKGVLNHSTFEREIDRFLGGLIYSIKCPLDDKKGNLFYSFIDGALFNISKALKLKKLYGRESSVAAGASDSASTSDATGAS